jgi:phage terminase large subunit
VDEISPIRMYKDVEDKQFYVFGGDTAGEGSDSFVGQGINNTSLEQVVVLNHQFSAHQFADQIYCLGKYYNDAMLSIETNYGGTYVIERLQELGYTNFYIRESHDTYRNAYQKAYGFNTNAATRKPLIDNLIEVMDAEIGLNSINDKKTLEEMLTFVRNEKGRPEAAEGAHDDHVMALGIAHYTRHQQNVYISRPKPKEYAPFDGNEDDFNRENKIEVI